MYSLIGTVTVLLVLCHTLVGITFVKSDDCANISGIPPSPVNKSFRCLAYNWLKMTCWFDLGVVYRGWNVPGYTKVDIKVKYGILGMTEELEEQYIKRDGTCLKISILNNKFTLLNVQMDINITNEARKVSNISIFKFNPRDFVKPAPIENLKYIEKNSTAIKLEWYHSNSQMSKKFRIQYSSEYDPKGSWMITAPKTRELTLTKLLPYALYNITVVVIPIYENRTETGFWSDNVTTSIRTAEDVPRAVPTLWPGYFSQLKDPEKIKIYWEPIDDIKRCGIIQSYRITLKEIVPFGEKVGKKENFTEIIEDIPPEAISYEIQLEPMKKYQIKLTQRTSVGYPTVKDAHIYVYPQFIRPTLPSLTSVEAIGHNKVLFTWKLTTINNSTGDFCNYNLSWCKKNSTKPGNCKEAIKSNLILDNNATNKATVSISITKNYFDYWFGISVEETLQNGWFISSGITWYKHCVYFKGGVPKKPLELEVPTDTDQEDGIFIRWKPYTCTQGQGKVASYEVRFCTTGSAEDECEGKEQNETLSASESSYTLQNLIEGQTYIINISAKMEEGQYGPWTTSKKVLFKSTKTFESKTENLILGAAIGGIGAFVILVIVGIVYCRHSLKKQAEEVKEINLPTIKTKSGFDKRENNGSGIDTHESLQPLLRNSNGNDSGLGGSSTNGNSISQNNSLDKKHSNQNGSTGGYNSKHNNHIHQNSSVIQTDAIIESPGISENTNQSFGETSFTTGEMSGGNEMNSVDYTDVELHSSDEESSANNSSCVPSSNNSPKHSGKKSFYSSTNKSDRENKGFTDTDERGQDSSNIDSYCEQGETSAIDSYCQKGLNSSTGVTT
ncbi:interleukin-6 receptor subunit beta-like isoform X9 [Mytilus edulis]|uniref:interleukin-6 receptor subunit beta-like isoform X9 n=1 Tax=Mytilus edulis TaxID=6550 RepID=UPI0039EEA7DB